MLFKFIKKEEEKAWHGCDLVYYHNSSSGCSSCPVFDKCKLQLNIKKHKFYREMKRR
jgi:hypothetical protein